MCLPILQIFSHTREADKLGNLKLAKLGLWSDTGKLEIEFISIYTFYINSAVS